MTLADTLRLEAAGDDRFTGVSLVTGGARTFGGHLLAQAMLAATRTAPPAHVPHSLHAHFLRPGTAGEPVGLEVERVRDGRAFSLRRVHGRQGERLLVTVTVSLHAGEAGDDWQQVVSPPAPAVAECGGPTPLEGYPVMAPYEVRAVHRWERGRPARVHPYWARLREPIGSGELTHLAATVVLTDVGISGAARQPGGTMRDQRAAVSLDHAVWLHRPPRADRWLFVDAAATTNAVGRGLAQGSIRTEEGLLVATFVQEAVLREPGSRAR